MSPSITQRGLCHRAQRRDRRGGAVRRLFWGGEDLIADVDGPLLAQARTIVEKERTWTCN